MRQHIPALLVVLASLTSECAEPMNPHVLTLTGPVLEAEDGLLLGNGDLSVSVYQTRDRIVWRLGKSDVWDRRVDRRDDSKAAHIDEIAHGIAVERWKCGPYGGDEPVALNGTDNPARMKELCRGTPPSYCRRPYPCPKPTGELALHLPPDLHGLTVRQELAIEEGTLRVTCDWPGGVQVRLLCTIPPEPNVLVVRWELLGWTEASRVGNNPSPMRFALYRWADPHIRDFGERFFARYRHGAFLTNDLDRSSPLPPPTVRVLDGVPVVDQPFPADPTFPQGFNCLLAPFLSAGGVERPYTSPGGAELALLPPAEARSGWVVVSVATHSDAGGPEAEVARLQGGLAARPGETIDRWETEARQDAQRFWSRSGVRIADPPIENLWYETYHARRCTHRAGKTPPGLYLPSTVLDYSHWHGDYHTNYNFQQPYWGDYAANQIGLGDAYFDGMKYFLQMGRLIARDYYGTRGVFIQLSGYPIVAEDDVLGAVPMGRMAYMTGWAANHYWARYLHTRDDEWLRQTGYPVMRDCALFYLDFMKKGDDGLYHVFPSNQGEDGFSGDPKDYTDRAQVMRFARYCLRTAALASEVLDTDAELRAQWRDRAEHAAGDDGRPPYQLAGLEKHFYEANAPEFGDGRPYAPPQRTADGTPWPGAGVWTDLWYPGQYPLMTMPALRAGSFDPERGYAGLRRLVERWRHPNGLIWAMSVHDYGHCGAWTETLGICAPLQEMMLQSFGGVLRLFPAWPMRVAASFSSFRAEGAFLVSAEWAEGAVRAARIASERGGACSLYPPWTTGLQVTDANGTAVPLRQAEGGIVSFDTSPGGSYTLSPAAVRP
jgi:hypothetical protein